MTFNVNYNDVELYLGASFGFKGLFDEEGAESWKSKIKTEEDFKEAFEWSNDYLDKVYNAKNLADLVKNISPKIPYSLELKDDEIILNWTCPNRIFGEFHFGFKIIYANIS